MLNNGNRLNHVHVEDWGDGCNLMACINFLQCLPLTSSVPSLFFSTFNGADQLLNWHNNVINCFLVTGPTAFCTVKKYKSTVYLQAIKWPRLKRTYKRCPAVQSNWFCFINCISLVESKALWIGKMSYFDVRYTCQLNSKIKHCIIMGKSLKSQSDFILTAMLQIPGIGSQLLVLQKVTVYTKQYIWALYYTEATAYLLYIQISVFVFFYFLC